MEMLFDPTVKPRRAVLAAGLWLVLLATTSGLAQVNKCIINGKIVYTDMACPSGGSSPLQLQPLNIDSTGSPDGDPPAAGGSQYRSSEWFNDHAGYARALQVSREQNAPIFIYAYTDWCGYCKKLDSGLLSDFAVKGALAEYVKVRINPEHSAADRKLFRRWGGRGYPTLYIQTAFDAPPARTQGPFTRQNGTWKMMEKGAFMRMLENRL